jgi:two-component sensor histidine kinase
MTMSLNDTMVQSPARRSLGAGKREQKQVDALIADLQAALTREQALLSDQREQAQRQVLLAQEFEHRLVNGLQMVVSLLSMQSRVATTPEAAAQLTIAAQRVSALGRVHHRLHLHDRQQKVAFKPYLQQLCGDLSGLLFEADCDHFILVEGVDLEIPTASALPLGFIVNELITNAVKYGKGQIVVRIGTFSPLNHSISVLDDGPGLPADFDPAKSRGLGMKIVQALVRQIGGTLQFSPGDNGRGVCSTVTFCSA